MIDDDNEVIPDPPADADPKAKWCPRCGKWKPETEFFRRGKSQRLHGYCKLCHNQNIHREKIRCPHCREQIVFLGLDKDDNIVKDKVNNVLSKLVTEARTILKDKPKETRQRQRKSLKDIF